MLLFCPLLDLETITPKDQSALNLKYVLLFVLFLFMSFLFSASFGIDAACLDDSKATVRKYPNTK